MTRGKRLALELTLFAAAVGVGLWCSLGVTSPRYSNGFGESDFGGGRILRIRVQPHFGDPPSIWFEASRDGRPLHRPEGLGTVRGEYAVRTYWTPDGATSCTAAVGDGRVLFVYVDWPSGDVWPSGDDAALPRWTDRRRALEAAHPDLPADRAFPASRGP